LAKTQQDPSIIKDIVAGQLTKPVFWRESMGTLRQSGVNTLYEIGPGKVLSGLVRVNGFKRGTVMHSINNLYSIEKITELKTV
jgi:[acyl-carrier-protein] S-malonyltransferase